MERKRLLPALGAIKTPEATAIILFDAEAREELKGIEFYGEVNVLSEKGDTREAAARLFALLNELDTRGLKSIYAERVPEQGLGRAINDRLSRASYKAKSGLD